MWKLFMFCGMLACGMAADGGAVREVLYAGDLIRRPNKRDQLRSRGRGWFGRRHRAERDRLLRLGRPSIQFHQHRVAGPHDLDSGEYLPRIDFDSEHSPAVPITGGWNLRAAHDRLGAFLYRTKQTWEWIEMDFSGSIIGRWTDFRSHSQTAFTLSGNLYRQSRDGIAVFDRASSTWNRVADPAGGTLLGADGDDLVLQIGNRLRWLSVNSLKQARR